MSFSPLLKSFSCSNHMQTIVKPTLRVLIFLNQCAKSQGVHLDLFLTILCLAFYSLEQTGTVTSKARSGRSWLGLFSFLLRLLLPDHIIFCLFNPGCFWLNGRHCVWKIVRNVRSQELFALMIYRHLCFKIHLKMGFVSGNDLLEA